MPFAPLLSAPNYLQMLFSSRFPLGSFTVALGTALIPASTSWRSLQNILLAGGLFLLGLFLVVVLTFIFRPPGSDSAIRSVLGLVVEPRGPKTPREFTGRVYRFFVLSNGLSTFLCVSQSPRRRRVRRRVWERAQTVTPATRRVGPTCWSTSSSDSEVPALTSR